MPLMRASQLAKNSPAFQERLRGLSARLTAAARGKKARKVLITSPGNADGKTLLALTFAQKLALTGRRVLTVECDPFNPAFEAALCLRRSGGLQSVLRGEMHPRDAVVGTANPNLDALAAGIPTENPNNMLAQEQMSVLLSWAQDYDDVIIDGPPVTALTNFRSLMAQANEILLCLRCGRSSIGQAIAAIAAIEAAGGKATGLAITMDSSERLARQESDQKLTNASAGAI